MLQCDTLKVRGVEKPGCSRLPHKQETAGSNPAPATNQQSPGGVLGKAGIIMPRPFIVDAKFMRKLLEKALMKRYSVGLDDYLQDLSDGVAELKYPGSSDLAELTKHL